MVTTFQRMGAVGAVTDGGIRDLSGMRRRAPGFQMFAAGAVPSAGVSIVVEVGLTVSICGLTIRPGELLHGDENGLISIPHEVADKVAAEGQEVLRREQEKVDFIMSDEFSLSSLIRRQGWVGRPALKGDSTPMERINATKRKLDAGGTVFGIFVTIPAPRVIELCGIAGFDYVVIDAEHGPIDVGTCEELVRACDVSGLTPIVRVPSHEPKVIGRYLDVGAQGSWLRRSTPSPTRAPSSRPRIRSDRQARPSARPRRPVRLGATAPRICSPRKR